MRNIPLRWFSGFLAVSALAAGAVMACGSSDGGSADSEIDGEDGGHSPGSEAGGPPTKMSACKTYIQAVFDRRVECGSPPGGADQYLSLCPNYFFAEGSTISVDSLFACAEVRRTQSCDDVAAGLTPACSGTGIGTLAKGAPCRYGLQCVGGACIGKDGYPSDPECGHCTDLVGDGGACTSGEQCARNEECDNYDGHTKHCVPIDTSPRLPSGSPCSASSADCTSGTRCTKAQPDNTTAGTCTPPPAAGAPCRYDVTSSHFPYCQSNACVDGGAGKPGKCAPLHQLHEACSNTGECDKGLFCTTYYKAGGTCQKTLKLGDACPRSQSSYGDTECEDNGWCRATQDGGTTGTCVSYAAIGEPCDALHVCNGSARCSSDKVCVVNTCTADAGGH